jgi:hypothetical protein
MTALVFHATVAEVELDVDGVELKESESENGEAFCAVYWAMRLVAGAVVAEDAKAPDVGMRTRSIAPRMSVVTVTRRSEKGFVFMLMASAARREATSPGRGIFSYSKRSELLIEKGDARKGPNLDGDAREGLVNDPV